MKTYFENLKKSKDFDKIVRYIPFEDLQTIESHINQYETFVDSKFSNDFDTIEIKWWEGLCTTNDFIEFYIDLLNENKNKGYNVLYPSFNDNLSENNIYELRIYNPIIKSDELYYAHDGFCKEFETIDESFTYIENVSNKNNKLAEE